jgi:hypothetical protein
MRGLPDLLPASSSPKRVPLILSGTPRLWKPFQDPGVLDKNFTVYFGFGG